MEAKPAITSTIPISWVPFTLNGRLSVNTAPLTLVSKFKKQATQILRAYILEVDNGKE